MQKQIKQVYSTHLELQNILQVLIMLWTLQICNDNRHLGKESSGINPMRGQNNVQGACDMAALPNVFPGYQSIADEKIIEFFKKNGDKINKDGTQDP